MVIIGLFAALLFIGSLLCGWLWVRSAYAGPLEFAPFWEWLSDPKQRNMEPILVLIGLILSPVLAIAAQLLARFRATSALHAAVESAAAAKPTEWDRVRGDLIRTVRSHWIDDYLRHSVYQRVRIKLGIAKTPEAIDHPYNIERISGGNTELLTNVSLLRIFDESGGSLLILGEPGSGKTVTLVQLAGLLLDRAVSDPEAAVPVVVPLVSWAVDRKPLEEWLRGELVYHYGLSARTTPALLIEGKRLILLLDGLDEVRDSLRTACLAAIQRFKGTFAADVVVCCRVAEYQALPQKIPRGDAIRILPLTDGQINAYFAAFRGRLASLIQSLHTRAELRKLATAPLMLNILATIYGSEEQVAEVPASASQSIWRDAVFTRYVPLMFQRKERKAIDSTSGRKGTPFTRGQSIHWLQQIAKRMTKQQVTTLYLERLSPNWVIRRWKYLVTIALSYVAYGLVFGLLHGLTLGLIVRLMTGRYSLALDIRVGVLIGLSFSLIFGTIFGLIFEFIGVVQLVETVRLRFDRRKLFRGLIRGLVGAVIFGLISGLFFGLVRIKNGQIIDWMWAGFILGLVVGLLVGLMYGFLVGLIEMRSHPEPSKPNQGVRTSMKTSLVGGMILALLIAGAAEVTVKSPNFFAPIGFYVGSLLFGGSAVIRHYSIRLTLAWEGMLRFPLNDPRLVAFLDAMCDRILLTRIGGGWMFIHPLLLEFLAGEPFGTNPEDVAK